MSLIVEAILSVILKGHPAMYHVQSGSTQLLRRPIYHLNAQERRSVAASIMETGRVLAALCTAESPLKRL
jgi:hypothetical protein